MSKQPGRKSILASFASYTPPTDLAEGSDTGHPEGASTSRVAGVIGATQRSLAELREERDHFKQLAEIGGEVELDPELIDPSPFPDRLQDDDRTGFEDFKTLIASEGQLIPILVRHHPLEPARYQVVYGHRRLKAARELGQRVKAKIGDLDDRQLVLAQGIENSARQDLSWIEKALFVVSMDSAGVKARDIRAAIAVDDSELVRFRAVCRAVPENVLRAIGRAPKAGRTRWVAFLRACSEGEALERVRESLAHAKDLSSDDRFVSALNAALDKKKKSVATFDVAHNDGRKLGTATFSPGQIKITVNPALAPGFADFLQNELPDLVEKYRRATDT